MADELIDEPDLLEPTPLLRLDDQPSPRRRRALHTSWPLFAAFSGAVVAMLALAVWVSTLVHLGPLAYRVALFVHLAALVVGFGAVLAADYFGVLWLLKRVTLTDALRVVGRLHLPIWTGLAGLVISGAALAPHLSSPLTRVKLVLVCILTLNGLQTLVLSRRLEAAPQPVSARLLVWGVIAATLSHVCWWGAVLIGYFTTMNTVR